MNSLADIFKIPELRKRIGVTLAVLAVYFGFFSTPITDTTRASVDQLIQHYQSVQTVEAPVAEAAPAETAAH